MFAGSDAFEFLGYAGLDLEFEGFGAGGVRLICFSRVSIAFLCVSVDAVNQSRTSALVWRASTRFAENWMGDVLFESAS